MTPSGHQSPVALDVLVALALLRLGADTRAARVFHEVLRPGLPGLANEGWRLLERLADALEMPSADRLDRIGRARRRAVRALKDSKGLGLSILSALDPSYPEKLSHIPDPPIVLWVRGEVSVLGARAVAVVGSRRATPTGLTVSRRLSRELGEAGIVVVSGLARGIDAAAHRGALDAGSRTVGVLGNGADVTYPPEHRELAAEVAAAGALVTEFPPGTRPYASHFPLRNRIISGLCQAVVVIEASQKSGSLITARAALEQGRDVLAVPGSVASGCYRGCHALIKDGARLVEDVDDILEELGWTNSRRAPASFDDKSNSTNSLTAHMTAGDLVSVDELAIRTGRPAAECLAELGLLEIAGKVARTPGGVFVRLDGPGTNRQRDGV